MEPDIHSAAMELGLQPIHLACLEGDFEAVVVLCAEDGAMNALTEPQTGADWRLRESPIKLAALMGHLNIVEFFIERGATLVHDGVRNDTHASLYAREEGLAEQRRDFYLRTIRAGRENPDAVSARKVIYELLSSPGRRSVHNAMRGPRADLGYADYRLGKQGRHIVVYAPVYRIKTDIQLYRKKTIGVITTKGQGDILMAAHSGFRLGGDHDDKCLDTNKWNYIALHHIAALMKFKFPSTLFDNGARAVEDDTQRGRAHAGHVEVLLASWYALEMTRRVTGNHNASVDWLLARLHRLKLAATLGAARTAIIMIDHQPCATCLKFINRLYQYTGVYFAVLGSVGVGPTLATKDPRNNLRMDTFGDVFPMEDGEGMDEDGDAGDEGDDDEVEEVVPETPAAAIMRSNPRNGPPHNSHIPRPLPWMADRQQPGGDTEDTDDISHAARVVMERIARADLTMSAQPGMEWPIYGMSTGNRRNGPRKDAASDEPSRRPDNHTELVADYKKKTPVWQWPGYEAAAQAQLRSEDLQRRLATIAGTPCPPCSGGGEDADAGQDVEGDMDGDLDVDADPNGGADLDEHLDEHLSEHSNEQLGVSLSDEDMIIVDPHDDNSNSDDDAAAYSPSSNIGSGNIDGGSNSSSARQGITVPGFNERLSQRYMEEESPPPLPPRSPLLNSKVFLYHSFVPMPSGSGHGAGPQMLQAAAMDPRSDFRMQIDDQTDNNGNGDADSNSFYMVGPESSQRAPVDDSSTMQEEDADDEIEMVSAHFPPPRHISFQQFRYDGRATGKGKAPEAPMFQPRPIPNFRVSHRLGLGRP